jgi:hypothetical protein
MTSASGIVSDSEVFLRAAFHRAAFRRTSLRQKPLPKMVSFVLMREERQTTYQHRQVSYHRQDAGEVHSTAEVVDLQQLKIDHQNWHGRS